MDRSGTCWQPLRVEVELKPPFGGCLVVLISVVSLGAYPLLRRHMERRFIARMDDGGFATRAGRRYEWAEVTRIDYAVGDVDGATLSAELLVRTARGSSSLPLWRATNAVPAIEYMRRRVPEGTWPTP
jgi:hypothetical protein